MDPRDLSVRMSPLVYSSLLTLVEGRLQKPVWESRKISDVVESRLWAEYQRVVYVVLDKESRVTYVGSTIRSIAERLAEHIKIDNRINWDRVMIVPLKNGVVEAELRKFEGLIGRRLRPYDNSKLPHSSS